MGKPQGVIVMPPVLQEGEYIIGDRYGQFAKAIAKRCGFKVVYARGYDVPPSCRFVMTLKRPQKKDLDPPVNMASLKPHQVLIGYFADIHGGNLEPVMRRILPRYDHILSNTWQPFMERWPEFGWKLEFFPNFPADYPEYTEMPINEEAEHRCLVTGCTVKAYPLRSKVISMREECVAVLPHPGDYACGNKKWTSGVFGREYAAMLRRFVCGVATSSIHSYLVAKYFEIAATGSLLLANRIPDADKAGLVPGKHYIPIDHDNFAEVIRRCASEPNAFREVRLAGMDFVRKHHLMANRVETVCRIVKEHNGDVK